MRSKRWNPVLGLSFLVIAALACNFTTANISSLKLGKDKNVSQETSTFSPRDTIYAVATISNAPGAVKVKARLVIEDVAGQQSGPIPGLEVSVDMPASGSVPINFSPPTNGFPKGKYKVEVLMLNEGGEQKDQKAADFTIS